MPRRPGSGSANAAAAGAREQGGSWVSAPFRVVEERLRLRPVGKDEVGRAEEEELERAVPGDRRGDLQLERLVVEEVLDQLAAARLVELLRERRQLCDVVLERGARLGEQLCSAVCDVVDARQGG